MSHLTRLSRFSVFAMLIALAVALAACGAKNNGNSSPSAASPSASESPVSSPASSPSGAASDAPSAKTTYPLTVQDPTGQSLTFEKAPTRIVSVSPAETEILFALGLGDQVFGVSDYDNYPPEASSKPKMGNIMDPNGEAILAATPDLVIGGISLSKESADKLRSLKLPVYQTNPKKLDDIYGNIANIGLITDRQSEAAQLIAKMKADVEKVTEAVKGVQAADKKKVYVEFAPGWTVGSGEFMDELLTLAGATNVAHDTAGWNQISEEKIIQDNPDVILYTLGVKDDKTGKTIEEIVRARSGWDKIQAIKDNRIVGLDQDILSRPGPRLTQGLVDVAKAIYPDLIKP